MSSSLTVCGQLHNSGLLPLLGKGKKIGILKRKPRSQEWSQRLQYFFLCFFHHLRIPMSQVHRQWGVTAPISTDLPSEHEIKLTEDLVKTLHKYGLFESEQEAQNR